MDKQDVSGAVALETIIDRHSLTHVLGLLNVICCEKASHIEHAWGDKATARPWMTAANAIDRLAHKVQDLGI